MTPNQNTCNICNKSFNSEQELREHQRTAHQSGTGQSSTGKKDQHQDNPTGGQQNPCREDKIAG